jgi:tetratricopeptide (TPR) repeat protein
MTLSDYEAKTTEAGGQGTSAWPGPARRLWSVLPGPASRWRALTWSLALLALVLAVLLAALLLWRPQDAAAKVSTGNGRGWLPGGVSIPFFPTPTPTPAPTPTLTPRELAAQFYPQLQSAVLTEHWDRALDLVAIIRNLDPAGTEVQSWAFWTHMQYGQFLVIDRQAAVAQEHFDEAVSLSPTDEQALLWQETTELYLSGRQALEQGEWAAAIESFTEAEQAMADYPDLFERLVEAYRRQGVQALDESRWPLAITSLTYVRERTPQDPEIDSLLSLAYRGRGKAAMDKGEWAVAVETLNRARSELPGDQEVRKLLSLAYQGQGKAAMAEQDWATAIQVLTEARERLPQDQDVVKLLATAYRQRGTARYDSVVASTFSLNLERLKQAQGDLETALSLQPGDAEAKAQLGKVNYLLNPPKRIEISISKQRLYAYQGGKLVYSYTVSTGLRGRDTATGHFRVLSKIPMAYSRIWRLKMPNWIGIYYVQGIENGIHALPIRPDGSVMWGGLLGQRASYGCVILSNQAAKTIYNWVEIGTRVDIRN